MDGSDRAWKRPPHPAWQSVGVWTATAVSRTLASYAIVQGVTVAAFGSHRWASSPALQTALQLPGRTTTWGVVLAVAGSIALFGSLTRQMALTSVGHWLAGLWSLFFAVSQVPVALNSSTPTTGIFVYAAEAVLFFTVAVGAWRLR